MSANPEDRLVTLLSHWLARHAGNTELLRGLDETDLTALEPAQAAAVEELRSELRSTNGPAELEMVVRETLEALALGG